MCLMTLLQYYSAVKFIGYIAGFHRKLHNTYFDLNINIMQIDILQSYNSIKRNTQIII